MTEPPHLLPPGLPEPPDDGGADHLAGAELPDVALASTRGGLQNVRDSKARFTVLYCYPKTGRPDRPMPDDWDLIPGARGCTPQACSFRDHHAELESLDAVVFGVSTQDTGYQAEAAERLHLPFPLLSDQRLVLADALELPTFEAGGSTLLRRLTLIAESGRIAKVFYPVFPPDRNAADVVRWLQSHAVE